LECGHLKAVWGWDVRTQTELSSRPERSAVEGPAVSLPFAAEH
jgi:hypothetical protein